MTNWLNRFSAAALALLLAGSVLAAQAPPDTAELGRQIRARFDVVALRDGVGLVPHDRDAGIRLIEVRDGTVAINGEPATARELRTRVGRDADLILRVTYLDAAAQRELVGAAAAAAPPLPPPASSPSPEPAPPATEDRESPERSDVRRGDLVRFGGSVTVGRDERIDGDVVVVGGSADIDGEVEGDVTVVGGSLNLSSTAVVHGDANAVGGSLNREPGARVDGKVDEVGFGGANVRVGDWSSLPIWGRFWQVGNLVGTLLRFGLLMLGALVVVALGGRHVEAVAERTWREPVRAGFAGLLAEVLFVPMLVITIIVLAVSIIGIPLLLLVPFALVLTLVLMLIGFTGVAAHVGRTLGPRVGVTPGPYASVAFGVVVILALAIVARLVALAGGFVFGGVLSGSIAALGFLVEYVAWTIGIGAVVLTWLGSRRRTPPLPTVAMVPTTDAPGT